MNPVSRIKRWVGTMAFRAWKYTGMPLRDPALVKFFGGIPEPSTGEDVTERTALNCSAVFAAVRLIAESRASLPPVVYRVDTNGGKTIDTEHRASELLRIAPNPRMTPFVFAETVQSHSLLWGNGYAEIVRERDKIGIRELNPLTPDKVTPKVAPDGRKYYEFADSDAGEPRKILDENMIHVPGLGFDGLLGYSPIRLAAQSIGLALAAERFGGSFFGRGATLQGVITHPGELGEQARKNLRDTFRSVYGGPDGARIGVLDEGMKFERIGIPPEDAQFLGTREFSVVEIARWFNVPPHLLRDLSHATFSNIEHQGLDFLLYTLRPWLIKVEQEYMRKLFIGDERRLYHIEHDVSAILRADIKTRYEAYQTGRLGGWLSLNDILRDDNRNPLPGPEGEARLMPVNYAVIGQDQGRSPIDMNALSLVTEFVKAQKPLPWQVAVDLYRSAIPQADDTLINGLVAKLESDNYVEAKRQ